MAYFLYSAVENIKYFETSELSGFVDKYSLFLIEIRKRILFTLCVFAVAALVGFVFYERIIRFLIDILNLSGLNIVFTSPFQFINLATSCGLATGFVLVFPLIVFQVLAFLRSALKNTEYKILVGVLPLMLVLFLIGFLFGALIMKWQIQISLSRSVSLGIGNILDISSLLTTVILTATLMGIGFQFPILLLLILRLGIIKQDQLSKQRLWVYLGSFIFAVLLPPDSVLADFLLTLPFIILFELTLILNRFLKRKNE